MKSGRGIVEIFGRCSRGLSKIALDAEDGFFSQLCVKESDKLLSEFIFFLKGTGAQEHHVAQYCLPLILRIKNILNLLDILKHLGFAKPPTSLLLERDLLLLKLSVLGVKRPMPVSSGKTEKPVAPKPEKKPHPLALGRPHKEILEFIKGKERTKNLEIFNQFSHITRRTLKKNLSALVKANSIKRIANGKEVFYSVSAES